LTNLTSATGSPLCIDGSDNVVECASGSITLQIAYDGGNTITTTDARNISFTLANTTTDSNFVVTTAADSTGYSYFALADGGTTPPSQLMLVENLDVNTALNAGIRIQSEAGGITNALDLSDTQIV